MGLTMRATENEERAKLGSLVAFVPYPHLTSSQPLPRDLNPPRSTETMLSSHNWPSSRANTYLDLNSH